MKKILTILLITLCSILSGQSHIEMLKNAPVIDPQECSKEREFKQSICSFKDIDTVRYSHINLSPVHDFKSVKKDIDTAIKETFILANKIAIEDSTNLDLVIRYEYLDGIGGTLAKAHFPSCNLSFTQVVTFDNYDVPPGKNTPDSLLIYYKNLKNISVITRHEIGHILGRKHDEDNMSMMYPYYNSNATWSKQDSLFFFLNFGITNFISIKKEDSYLITPNFNIIEYFSKCEDMNFHMLDKRLIVAAQKLRDFYGSPIIITSTYRHKNCNTRAGGASKSQHLAGRGIDFKFLNPSAHIRFTFDVQNQNYIVSILKSCKINGIGLYNSHIHLDTRSNSELVVFDKTNLLMGEEGSIECGL